MNEIGKTPDISFIIQIFENPSKLDFDSDGLFFFNDDGDKIYCPEILTSISEKGEWLSDKLPSIGFDIDQNGNVRKASEAEALYCCTIVSHIIKEESFKNDLNTVANSYNFHDMKPLDINFKSFRDLLIEWQSLQSVIINIIISASKCIDLM